MTKLDTINKALMKLRTVSDQLNEMNAFSVEFDEGIEFAVMQINKIIQYLSAVSKTELSNQMLELSKKVNSHIESELSNAGTK